MSCFVRTGKLSPTMITTQNNSNNNNNSGKRERTYDVEYRVTMKKKQTRACDFCKQRKRKCSGNHPCNYCNERKQVCTFSQQLKRGKRKCTESM